MKYIVQFSGGACSFWAAHRAVEKYGAENVILLFADVKMEDADLYRFNRDVERVLGIKITVIADGRNPWEVFRDNHMIGNARVDMCSRELKRELLMCWIKANHQPADTTLLFGMDWTEGHRLSGMQELYAPFAVDAPMQWEPIWDKCKMVSKLSEIGIDPPQLYKEGFPHNNCGGFCVKAGQAHFALLLKKRPDTYAYHENQEQIMRDFLKKDVAILRDRRGGKTRPLTLKEFRGWVERGDFDKYEWGGCGCATS